MKQDTHRALGSLLLAAALLSGLPGTGAALAEEAPRVVAEGADQYPDALFLGGRLCYVGGEGILSCAPDGSDARLLSAHKGTLFTDGEALFCGSKSRITRIDPDGGETLVLEVYPLVNEGAFRIMNTMGPFAVRNGWIYYTLTMAQDLELWKVGTDGEGNRRVASICPPDREVLELLLPEDGEDVFARCSGEDGERWSLFRLTDGA